MNSETISLSTYLEFKWDTKTLSAGPDAPISTFSISKILNSKSENSLLRGKIDKYQFFTMFHIVIIMKRTQKFDVPEEIPKCLTQQVLKYVLQHF